MTTRSPSLTEYPADRPAPIHIESAMNRRASASPTRPSHRAGFSPLADHRRALDFGLATLLVMSLFATDTPLRPRLVTNEYAHWNPTAPGAPRSSAWDMTSGSLFAHDDAWWTGAIDDVTPDPRSVNGTDSAVFRLTTHVRSFRNVRVTLGLRVETFAATARTPAEPWDGVHIFLR